MNMRAQGLAGEVEMTNDINKNDDAGNTSVSSLPATVDGSRRRFTSAGIAATGVVMTLASRPVLGCTSSEAALSPSGWSSINASRCVGPASTVSLGKSPGYWKHEGREWPTNVPKTTLYRSVFPVCTPPFNNSQLAYTLLDALTPQVVNNEFGRLIATAYLNAVSRKTAPYLRPEQVVQMATGSFLPSTGGKVWDMNTIIAYLKITFD
ncbi:MAG: hypothetical protein V4695_00470 [Pseudomonadota bacterium]